MKNNFKFGLGIVLISMLSTGCKKNSTESTEPLQKVAFTISSNTFKDGIVDLELLKKDAVNKPDISWENPPFGSKAYYVVMTDDKENIYINNITSENNLNKKNDFKISHILVGNTAKLEVFALSCTPDQFKQSLEKNKANLDLFNDKNLGTKFSSVVQKYNMSKLILGSAMAKYTLRHPTTYVN